MWFIVMLGGGRFSAAIFKGFYQLCLSVYFFLIHNYHLV